MNPPLVAVRLDCGPAAGLGHVGRCLPVAQVLAGLGATVRFVVAGGEPGPDRLRQAGFAVDVLPALGAAAFRDWLSRSGTRADAWLFDVRDDLGPADLAGLRPALLAVLDDPTDKRLAADLAFYPPVPQVREMDWTSFDGRLLVGFDFVPLDPRLAAVSDPPDGQAPCLLLTMGGTDPHGLTLLGLRALALTRAPLAATVVVPRACPVRAACLELGARLSDRVRLVDGPLDLLPLFAATDLALAAFGSTAYELAALGRPAVLLGISPDHARAAACLADADAAVNAGNWRNLSPETLARLLNDLLTAPARRRAMARAARSLGLGAGAQTVASTLLTALSNPAPFVGEKRP